MSTRLKILVPMIGLSAGAALIIGLVGIFNITSFATDTEIEAVTRGKESALSYLNNLEGSLQRSVRTAAKSPEVVAGMRKFNETGDRKDLIDAIVYMKEYSEDGIFFTVSDAEGKAAARSIQQDRFGDSQTQLAHVRRALAGESSIEYASTSNNPVAIRVGAPIMHNGKLIGVISGGFDLTCETFIDNLKSVAQTDVSIFHGETRMMTTVLNEGGQRAIGAKADPKVVQQVLGAGQTYSNKMELMGRPYYTYYSPIKDVNGKSFAMIFSGLDISETEKMANGLILMIAGIILGACAIAAFVALKISNNIANPLKALSNAADRIAIGDTDIVLNLAADHKSNDETLQLAASFKDLIEANKQQTELVGKVAMGDTNQNITPRSDKDLLSIALRDMIAATKKQATTMESISNGDLTEHIIPRSEVDTMNHAVKKTLERLNYTMEEIKNAAAQVTSASKEIASGSQSLAEGANEQASSLEEISSSLEEISSMTKQNADNSNQAKILVGEAITSVSEANDAMHRMTTAIHEIKNSSDNTAKIIKTIDDIAFQTNLLALNAAVEAARAGDAGKGFAVVAEEVRSLAMRSAEAAKTTTDMIEESVKNAENGVKITDEVASALNKTVERTTKVNDIIGEIAAASSEQATGIEQVNTGVAQMNQVTHQNAANSEESASAAEELSSQAIELSNLVDNFKLAHDSHRPSYSKPQQQQLQQHQQQQWQAEAPAAAASRSTEIIPLSASNSKQKPKSQRSSLSASNKMTHTMPKIQTASMAKIKASNDIIPLDDDDLRGF